MTQNILVICGSLRSGSINRKLADTLPDVGPAGMTFVNAPSIADIPHYNADLQEGSGFPAAVTALGDAIRAADGVIIVSPEYNFSVPGVLKNAIDWVSRLPDQPFKDKPVAIQSASGGMLGGARMQYDLRKIMVFLEAMVLTKPEVFVGFGPKKLNEAGDRIGDTATRDALGAQLTRFSEFVALLSK